MIGMMMSPTSEFTIAPKAKPMMTPTARSTTLPFMANSRNSLSIQFPLFASEGPLRSRQITPNSNSLIDQAGMHHGAAHGHARRLGHRYHRQAQCLVDLAEQRKGIFY